MLVARGSTVNISTCKFEGNNATEGGAIVANIGSIVSICNSSFLSNMADFGGCLYGRSSTTNIQSSTFDKNWSSQSGGCFYFESSIANFKSIGLSLNNAIKEGGGICLTFTSLLTIENSHVDSNMAFNGGGIAALSDSRLLCGRTTIFNNTAAQGGGLYFESNMKHIIIAELQTSSVKNNKALRFGGGMVVKSFGGRSVDCANTHNKCSRVLVVNTDFKSNTAATTGAAILATKLDNILLDCYTDSIWLDYFDFYSRQQLQKSIDDGHFYELDPKELCYSWKGNWLPHDAHGGIIGTFGLTLSVTTINTNGTRINEGSTSRLTLKNVKSGTPLPSIKMVAIDAFGNIYAPTLHEKDALMLSSMDDFLQQPISSSFTNGTCIVRGIISYILPGNYTIQVHSREDDILEKVNITISVRECVINEEPTSDKKFCEKCGIASYNFNITKVNGCTQCPKGASCNGSFIVPMEGYWHKGPCHDRVKNCIADKACKDANRAKAIANVTRSLDDCRISNETLDKYDEAQCHKGYKGPLCGSCNSTYGFSSNFECLKCARAIVVILRFLGAIAYLLIGAIISIKGVLPSPSNQLNEQDKERPLLEPSSSTFLEGGIRNQTIKEIEAKNGDVISQQLECEENDECSNQSVQQNAEIEVRKQNLVECWKICLNFFQVTSTAASMDVEWTKKILGMLEGLNILGATIIGSVSYSIDCLISSSSNATKAIWKLLFSLFVPNIVILLLALHWVYRCFTRHGRNLLYFSKRLLLTVVTVTYITYFDLTQVAVGVFSCVGVHNNESHTSHAITRYWIGDTSIKCYENTHLVLIGIALAILVLVSICFPVLCSITLSQKSDEIEDKTSWTYETLGFLGGPFKKTYVYWECITMIKKALLSIIIVFSYSLGNQIQGLLILLVLVLFLYLHFLCYPYANEYHTLNYYESGSLLISCVTYTLVQFFNVERCSKIVRGMVSLLLIALNGGFLCLMAFKIVKEATQLIRAFLNSKNIRIPEKANIVTLLRVYSKVKRSRFSSA
eukprot:g3838.t1